MYDPLTVDLIRRAPRLRDLDRDGLPDWLTESYATIVAERLRLRTGEAADGEKLAELVARSRRLAFTNEALVSVSPDRDDRAAAAFVAATAHQLVFNAERIHTTEESSSFLNVQSVSSDIAAMLLFLVAEASADAVEMAQWVHTKAADNLVVRTLILALRDLAQGRLGAILDADFPPPATVQHDSMTLAAALALYRAILKGVRMLAHRLTRTRDPDIDDDPVKIFHEVKSLCVAGDGVNMGDMDTGPVSAFSGPNHLASILIAVARNIVGGAVVAIPSPKGINSDDWRVDMEHVAGRRPFLWRNHREAIGQNYLDPGTSAVANFPTGSGKSMLAELKIRSTLLTDRTVIFLAPTHALVDQTRHMLDSALPEADVRRDTRDQISFLSEGNAAADILVMTPEACLAHMSFKDSILERVGLLVFDECHLLHPKEGHSDRRALDAMLCVLNFAWLAPEADFLFLSAMMRNAKEIASWVGTLTKRPCLALSSQWKPTRQLRGSIVYRREIISELESRLNRERRSASTKSAPAVVKQSLLAEPFGLFCLKQTWETRARDHYAFLPLLRNFPLLGVNRQWRLTPNSGEVSSAIAEAAAISGVKTLVFFQTIRNAAAGSRRIGDRLHRADILLSMEERALCETAAQELGGTKHLYLRVEHVEEGYRTTPTAVHHGLLLPEERRLVESLYSRPDGLSVLTATSTVSQGMNLPSELVIIAEDSRFDQETNVRRPLEARELLNAAGRAGRAGQNANGIVLVIPGEVIGFDSDQAKIGSHWETLREIFAQSDQCLDIDDPLTAILDRVNANLDDADALDRYCVSRLTGGEEIKGEFDNRLSWTIGRSLAGFKARVREDQAWVQSRVRAAISLLARDRTDDDDNIVYRVIAAKYGFPIEAIVELSEQIRIDPLPGDTAVTQWRRWFFSRLIGKPELFEQIFRLDDIEYLFGKPFRAIEGAANRTSYAVDKLETLTRIWMGGQPLRDIEMALGVVPEKVGKCNGARKFVVRIVPNLAYAFRLIQDLELENRENVADVPSTLFYLDQCVRYGFDTHEKAALYNLLHQENLSRRALHRRFEEIRPYLGSALVAETSKGTRARVQLAMNEAR